MHKSNLWDFQHKNDDWNGHSVILLLDKEKFLRPRYVLFNEGYKILEYEENE